MKNFLNFVLNRARERSTWLGIVSLLTAVGLALTEGQQEAIIAAGVAVAGLITVMTIDKDKA